MTAQTLTTGGALPKIDLALPPETAGGQHDRRSTFPLLPRHQIHLFAPHGEGHRFARLFAGTWGRIPLGPRRSILRLWRRPCPPLGGLPGPQIHLLNEWSDRQRGRRLRGDKAVVSWKGNRLRFWRRIVAAYPDDLVRDLIAHELAHVYQESRDFEFEDAYECEHDADMMAEFWGFSTTAIDDWDLANGVSRVIEWDSLSRSGRRRVIKESERSGRLRTLR